MRKFLVLALLCAGLVIPSSAQATTDDYFRAAGPAYWANCCGTSGNPRGCPYVSIYHWTPNGAAGYSDWSTCQVWINSAAFTSWPAGRACMIVLHEYGHGYGAVDTLDPNDVMYYATLPWSNVPYVRWPCAF